MPFSKRLLALPLALFLLAAACGDNGGNADPDVAGGGGGDPTTVPGNEGGGVSGEVNISGSSTVEPISSAVADLFEEANPGTTVNVDGPGTGDGFKLFCEGETDISDASRPIKDEEAATCEQKGVKFIELKVAFDGISVLTNPANESVNCLTFPDLYALVGPESQGVGNWKDAQPLASELGSKTSFPDLPLKITAPGEESGTYDSFIEITLAKIAKSRSQDDKSTRPDYSSQADDNAIIQGIEGDDGSFGWVGFAFAQGAGKEVKELEIDGGKGCVAPSDETIADQSYPVSRPLFIYVNADKAMANPAIPAYVDLYLGKGIDEVGKVGYVALPGDQLGKTKSTWDARTVGTQG